MHCKKRRKKGKKKNKIIKRKKYMFASQIVDNYGEITAVRTK